MAEQVKKIGEVERRGSLVYALCGKYLSLHSFRLTMEWGGWPHGMGDVSID